MQVVKRMAADLNLAVTVVGCETIREADGLAMSSRNARLSPEARVKAPALYAAMQTAAAAIRGGVHGFQGDESRAGRGLGRGV